MPKEKKTKNIFIVEDNETYAKTLEKFLKTKFPEVNDIKIFPIGEASLVELYQNPSVIIIDHLLNSVRTDAATGLSIIKEIKNTNPGANVILLSAQKEFDVVSKSISKYGCKYVKKDELAFSKVEEIVKEFLQEGD